MSGMWGVLKARQMDKGTYSLTDSPAFNVTFTIFGERKGKRGHP